MTKWRTSKSFAYLNELSDEELSRQASCVPIVHTSLRELLQKFESGKISLDYPGGLEQLKKDVELEEKGLL